jgi:SAM-dependent methyltransferase
VGQRRFADGRDLRRHYVPSSAGSADSFPDGFFARVDESDDALFYAMPRLVTHLDQAAIAAVGELYERLAIDGDVLDLMASWVSHFRRPPRQLTVLGMNETELAANPAAAARIVHDLNADPRIPLPDESVDDVVCCASVDYLTDPIAVFQDTARVLRPGGRLVCTFSNRVFATKAIRGWLYSDAERRPNIVVEYFRRCGAFAPATAERLTTATHPGDPLHAVWGTRS